MTTIYTPILKEYFWEWATVPVIHTLDYQNIQSFDPGLAVLFKFTVDLSTFFKR